MVNKDQIEKGIAAYIDGEIMPQIHVEPWKMALIGTGASIIIKRAGCVLDGLKNNTVFNALGISDKNGAIDIDIIANEFKQKMPPEGIKISVPLLGEMTFHSSDVDLLYKKIIGG